VTGLAEQISSRLADLDTDDVQESGGPSAGSHAGQADAQRHRVATLDRIDQLGGTAGPYALQAAIAACHARATAAEDTDWVRIAALYDGLAQISPTTTFRMTGRVVGISVERR
jgi:hypothetical protein